MPSLPVSVIKHVAVDECLLRCRLDRYSLRRAPMFSVLSAFNEILAMLGVAPWVVSLLAARRYTVHHSQ